MEDATGGWGLAATTTSPAEMKRMSEDPFPMYTITIVVLDDMCSRQVNRLDWCSSANIMELLPGIEENQDNTFRADFVLSTSLFTVVVL